MERPRFAGAIGRREQKAAGASKKPTYHLSPIGDSRARRRPVGGDALTIVTVTISFELTGLPRYGVNHDSDILGTLPCAAAGLFCWLSECSRAAPSSRTVTLAKLTARLKTLTASTVTPAVKCRCLMVEQLPNGTWTSPYERRLLKVTKRFHAVMPDPRTAMGRIRHSPPAPEQRPAFCSGSSRTRNARDRPGIRAAPSRPLRHHR